MAVVKDVFECLLYVGFLVICLAIYRLVKGMLPVNASERPVASRGKAKEPQLEPIYPDEVKERDMAKKRAEVDMRE